MNNHECRVCGNEKLDAVLDLGNQKIANYFHDNKGEELPEAPLVFARCPACGMAQLTQSVNTDLMYRRYWYTSSMNDTMRQHLLDDARLLMSKCSVSVRDVVIDIGCNDGTFLSCLPQSQKIGVDPSNIQPQGCEYIHDYFTYDAVREALRGRKAKVISSIAMFYDLSRPLDFVQDVRKALRDDGVWLLELSYLPRMVENTAYDSICHEHVAYYSLTCFMRLVDQTDFKVVSLDFNDMNGGSFRMMLSPKGEECPHVSEIMGRESDMGYLTEKPFVAFRGRVVESRARLCAFAEECVDHGARVYGYGASTKGQVIMQYCDLSNLMVAIAERNEAKYGLHTPGTNVRICSEQEMRAAQPDFLLVFPWYFIDEFLKRERSIRASGTKIVVPLPKFAIM